VDIFHKQQSLYVCIKPKLILD